MNKKSRRNNTGNSSDQNSEGLGNSIKQLWNAVDAAIDRHLVDEAWSFDDAETMATSDKWSGAHADFARDGAAVEPQSPQSPWTSEHEDDFTSIGGSTASTSETGNRTYTTSAYSTSACTRTSINGILSCSPRFTACKKEDRPSRDDKDCHSQTPHVCFSDGVVGQIIQSAGELFVNVNLMCADSLKSVNQTCNEKMDATCGAMKHTNDDTKALNTSFGQRVATNLHDQLNALLNDANINASFSKGEPDDTTQKSPPKSNSASIFRQNASPTVVDGFLDDTAKFHDDPVNMFPNDEAFGGFDPFDHTEEVPKMQRNLIFQDLLESEKENIKPWNAKKQTLKPKQSHNAIFLAAKTDSAGFPLEKTKADGPPMCNNCGKGGETDPVAAKALKLCSQCQSVYYCSVDCQRDAWILGHHGVCKPVAKARMV